MSRLVNWVLLGGVALGWIVGSSGASTVQRIEGPADGRQFAFRLTTPDVQITEVRDGSHQIEIKGFGTPERRAGAPDLFTKTVLIAIPPGAVPRLEVRPGTDRIRRGIRPRPVPRVAPSFTAEDGDELARADLPRERREEILDRVRSLRYDRDPDIYDSGRVYPERLAWLGEIGVLRAQRYVEVHVAPVRYDSALAGLRVQDSIELIVHFDDESPQSSGIRPEPRFEPLYRRSFLNYEQGLSFRLGARPAGPATQSARSASGAVGSRHEIVIREEGPRRLDHSILSTTGLIASPISNWRLTNRGVVVPLQIEDNGNDILENGEWVQFYAQALDDEPKTVLNTDFSGNFLDIFEATDYSDENVYVLSDGGGGAVVGLRDAAPPGCGSGCSPPLYFVETVHLEADTAFRPLGGADPWYWGPSISTAGTLARVESVPLPGLFQAAGADSAQVRVHVRGLSTWDTIDPDHLTLATLSNSGGQVLATDAGSFDDRTLHLHDFNWTDPGAGPALTDPVEVRIEVQSIGGARNDVILDYIEVDYRRSFMADGDLLVFEWPDEAAEFVISGFSTSAVEVWELTVADGEEVIQPVRLTGINVLGIGPYAVHFRIDEEAGIVDGSPRRFLVAGDPAFDAIPAEDFTVDTVSSLRDNANRADLIVIGHPEVMDTGPAGNCGGLEPSGCLQALLDHRATPAGGDLDSIVASLDDVADEFNFGLSGPGAIREFLRWVMSDAPGEGWAEPKPAFVLLLGDASYDYKGGTASGNYLPTQIMLKDILQLGYYASDNVMAAVVGPDPLADLVVGRIAARDFVESNRTLKKILDYEQSAHTGSWTSTALLLADRGAGNSVLGEALSFESVNEIAEGHMDRPPYTSVNLRYWSDFCDGNPDQVNCDTVGMRLAIKSEVNAGAALVQFVGHGGFPVWSNDAFFDERTPGDLDTDDLANEPRLPWMLAHNCLTGGFHSCPPNGDCSVEYPTMGEDWLAREGGGAVAVFAPSGLSFDYIGSTVTEVLWPAMFGSEKQRDVATLVSSALAQLCADGNVESCQSYVLQGDPATRLALRGVDAPDDLDALAGNSQVDLTWSPSETPGVTYDLYRKTVGTYDPYQRLNASPIVGPSFLDTTAINAQTYIYYVLAVDQGFESAWSNFNSDCTVEGPDCVQATPLNPGPPSPPSGLYLTDPGLGDALELNWSPNPELDIAHYTVSYGPDPGPFDVVAALGNQTRHTLQGLVEGQPYHVVLTATNTSGNTSAPSEPVSGFPAFGLGLRAPDFVDDLRLGKQGSDALLVWDEIVRDVYGKPKQVACYEIHRGTERDGLVLVEACAPGCESGQPEPRTCTYAHAGGLLDSAPFYYRVRAVDSEGNPGGLGAELPGPTELSAAWSDVDPDNVVLTWTPVNTTLDGTPLDLLHYAVYVAAEEIDHAAIRDGALLPHATVAGTSIEITPPVEDQYYSVLAVDIRGNRSPF